MSPVSSSPATPFRSASPARHGWILLALLAAVGLSLGIEPHPAHAQAPETARAEAPSEEQRRDIEALGRAFARGINAGSAEEREEVAASVFSRAALSEHGLGRLAGLFARLREDLGPVEHHDSELAEVDMGSHVSRILHVYVRATAQEQWKDLQLRVEPGPPFRIQGLGFLATVAEPVYLPNGALTDASTLAWLDGYIDDLVAEEGLGGSILVARGDEVLLERTFGYADAAGERPLEPDTPLNLGSGNKMFTALAAARLVEEGRLDWDAPLQRFFPDFPHPEHARRVTLGHLLSHTSGIGEYWTPEYEARWGEIDGLGQMLPFVYRAGTTFPPGTRWSYSNSNFVLAGLIVERVTGRGYYEVVRELILDPLEMEDSGFFLREGGPRSSSLARPLVRAGEGWAEADQPLRGSSAGGGYSTARDMLRFTRGLVTGRIVSPETLEEILVDRTEGLEAAGGYGYGFALHRDGGVISFGHGGTAAGVNFELRYFPSADLTLVAFGNQDNGAWDSLVRNTVRLATGAR